MGLIMAATGLFKESRQVLELGERAHQLIDQFIARQTDDPERSWESLVELQALIEQLRSICPPRTFRRNAPTPDAHGSWTQVR
jgi:hypothetical protein